MESSQQHFENQQPGSAGFSDIKRLKNNGAASVVELREFLGQLKGRSPQEVMGVVAQSSLIQGITTATIVSAVLLVMFTVVPYAIYGGRAAATQSEPAAPIADVSTNANSQQTPLNTESISPQKIAAGKGQTDLQQAAKAMGIDKAAEADPDKNPLDSKLDNLLDGIE